MYSLNTTRENRKKRQTELDSIHGFDVSKRGRFRISASGLEPIALEEPLDLTCHETLLPDLVLEQQQQQQQDEVFTPLDENSLWSYPSTASSTTTLDSEEQEQQSFFAPQHFVIRPAEKAGILRSPVKANSQGIYPQTIYVGRLFDLENIDYSTLVAYIQRENADWKAKWRVFDKKQTNVNVKMHIRLMNWMLQFCEKLQFPREAFHFAVSIIMRFLCTTARAVSPVQHQLVGTVAIWIVKKLELQADHPEFQPKFKCLTANSNTLKSYQEAHDFLRMVDDLFSPKDLLDSEQVVLTTLEGDYSLRTAFHWINIYISWAKQQQNQPKQQSKEFLKQLTEFHNMIWCYRMLDCAMMHIELACMKPSVLAIAILMWKHPQYHSELYQLTKIGGRSYNPRDTKGELYECIVKLEDFCMDIMQERMQSSSTDTEAYANHEWPETLDEQEYDSNLFNLVYTARVKFHNEHCATA